MWKREKVAKGRRVKAIGFWILWDGGDRVSARPSVSVQVETHGKEPVESEEKVLHVLIEERALNVGSVRLWCAQ